MFCYYNSTKQHTHNKRAARAKVQCCLNSGVVYFYVCFVVGVVSFDCIYRNKYVCINKMYKYFKWTRHGTEHRAQQSQAKIQHIYNTQRANLITVSALAAFYRIVTYLRCCLYGSLSLSQTFSVFFFYIQPILLGVSSAFFSCCFRFAFCFGYNSVQFFFQFAYFIFKLFLFVCLFIRLLPP